MMTAQLASLAMSVLSNSLLECPPGSFQKGTTTTANDISGCGLESCDSRYQDNYASIYECEDECYSRSDCMAYTWAPLDGDKNHPGKTVCTLYNSDVTNRDWYPEQVFCVPFLECPAGSVQVGMINSGNDIAGCGMEACDDRYQASYSSSTECQAECLSLLECKAFSWCPLNGDKNHAEETVCTLYNSDSINRDWGPAQVFCIPRLECPLGSTQVGTLTTGNDIGGCGLDGCDSRYKYESVDACDMACIERADCKAFSWTPVNGDKNHDDVAVCTLYNSDAVNQDWGPEQIFCVASTDSGLGLPFSLADRPVLFTITKENLLSGLVLLLLFANVILFICNCRARHKRGRSRYTKVRIVGSDTEIDDSEAQQVE